MFQPSSLSLSLYHYFHSFYLLPSIYFYIFLSLCFLVPIFLSLCFLVSIFLAIFLHHYCPSFDVFTSYYYYLFFPSFSLLHILFSLIFLFPITFSVSSFQISTSFLDKLSSLLLQEIIYSLSLFVHRFTFFWPSQWTSFLAWRTFNQLPNPIAACPASKLVADSLV